MKRMRQKIIEFFNKLSNSEMGTHGFPSNKCPSTVDKLFAFESVLLILIKKFKFK